MYKALIWIITGLLTIVLGLLIHSAWPEPSVERLQKKNDEVRVAALNAIIEAAHDFLRSEGRLPASLEELAQSRRRLSWLDPATGEPYEYVRIAPQIYSLCAVFETSATDSAFGSLPGFSRHGIGHTCVYRTFQP
jgi:hypothetical protein